MSKKSGPAHLNPVRAGLVAPEDGLDTYPWTSLTYYRKPPSKREAWECADRGLGCLGLKDTAGGRRKFIEGLELRAKLEKAEQAGLAEVEGQTLQSTLRRGWYFGSQAFRESLLKMAGKTLQRRAKDPNHGGGEVREHGKARAEEIVRRGLVLLEIAEADLPALPKSDWRKRLIALAVKRETPMKLSWVGERLHMGLRTAVSRYAAEMARRVESEKKLERIYRKLVG